MERFLSSYRNDSPYFAFALAELENDVIIICRPGIVVDYIKSTKGYSFATFLSHSGIGLAPHSLNFEDEIRALYCKLCKR